MTTATAPMKPATKKNHRETVNALTKPAQIRLARRSPAYWRVTIDNPPINVMGPEMVRQFQELIEALEAAGSHRPAALAGLSGATDPGASRLHRPHPRPCDRQRQRAHAGLRHEFR